MIEQGGVVVHNHRTHNLLHVTHLTTGADNHCSRTDDLGAVRIFLGHGQRVLASRHIHLDGAAEVAQRLHAGVQTGILTLLRTTWPHPVGRQGNAVQALSKRSPHDVGERFCHRKHRTGSHIGQAGLRGMTDGSGDSFLTTIVECHHTAVGQRKLKGTLTLLLCNLARHTAVNLVGEPVLASHGFQLKHVLQILIHLVDGIYSVFVFTLHGLVVHIGFRRMAEHLSHVEVERTDPVTLLKREVGVTGGLAYHIERSTLTLGNLAHMVDMFFLNEQSHTLLALVGDDFLRREGLVADRQLGHVDRTAAFLHQLRQAVHMTG